MPVFREPRFGQNAGLMLHDREKNTGGSGGRSAPLLPVLNGVNAYAHERSKVSLGNGQVFSNPANLLLPDDETARRLFRAAQNVRSFTQACDKLFKTVFLHFLYSSTMLFMIFSWVGVRSVRSFFRYR